MEALSNKHLHIAHRKENSQILSGWGHYNCISCSTELPDARSGLHACLGKAIDEAYLARGLGRSYGDAAVSARARIIKTEKLNRLLRFDSNSGALSCEPGVTFEDILNTFVSRGWFPPVTPGTKHVTMGGAFAADIHGKNHHIDGSFSDFVESIVLLDAAGQQTRCSRLENADLFWASAGGMGLTGLISELTIKLRAVKSPHIKLKKIRCANLNDTFNAIEKHEKEYHYSVSWIDALASGRAAGRSILILGSHAENPAGETSIARQNGRGAITVPFDMPGWLLNRYSISAFNELYYSLSSADGEDKLSHYEPYFYPLDSLSNWYRLYGRSGFIQYQCVLPLEKSREGMEEILQMSSRSGRSSFLAVLKKFGAGHGFLSFPMPGYTLTLDMPVKHGLFEFTRQLDEIVIKYGGRVYLAKDSCVSAEDFRLMYRDRVEEWLKVKRAVDPANRFSSALSERLRLF
jgi:decaprenylphospho-beta-D-ribofuranose 2-oxidase